MDRHAGHGLVIVLFVELAIPHCTSAGYLEERIAAALGPASGGLYRVRIGSSKASLLGRSFAATDLELSLDTLLLAQRDRAGERPKTCYSIRAASLRLAGIGLWPLLRGRVSVASATIEAPLRCT